MSAIASAAAMHQGAGGAAGTMWNPADKDPTIILSGGNLIGSKTNTGAAYTSARATVSKSTGSFIYSASIDFAPAGNTQAIVGFANAAQSLSTYLGSTGNNSYGYFSSGSLYFNNAIAAAVPSLALGDVVSMSFDGTDLRWFKNGTLVATRTPSAGISWFPAFSLVAVNGPSQITADFAPASPSGYSYAPWG